MAAYFCVFFALSRLVLLYSAEEEKASNPSCTTFHCGKLERLNFPFTKIEHPECGIFNLNCTEPTLKIQLGGKKWYEVTTISQGGTIIIRDQEFQESLRNRHCDSFKNLILPSSTFFNFTITPHITLFKCNHSLNIHPPTEFTYKNCSDYMYYNHPDNKSLPNLPPQCSIVQLPLNMTNQTNFTDPFSLLARDISLEWYVSSDCYLCNLNGGECLTNSENDFECANATVTGNESGLKPALGNKSGLKLALGNKSGLKLALGFGVAAMAILIFAVCLIKKKFISYKSMVFWKKETQNHQSVEVFLRNYGSLTPKRYSYTDIKRMTYSFKDKLGEGGYGGVYKGKLHDSRLVAVKVLNKSTGDGEEFVNEVASISRTAHVNIVSLLGFCFEGSKRALIYEFMPNGSLEKFIYDKNQSKANRQLGWETLYQIAIGIARGLEYLHRGCNTQILHFDIKPHNILLDEEFCPKISDFGLAKLCPKKQSIISMLGARGTAGYIAPEVFCRNFGGVSHKSDVYSYGMMVLEMVGGRKNIDVGVDRISEIYFPHWIYTRLEHGDALGLLGVMNEEDNEKARKMILVGLWCIQTDPSNRPPIGRVVEMLQGSLGSLQIPPRPFLSSPPRSPADSSTTRTMTL